MYFKFNIREVVPVKKYAPATFLILIIFSFISIYKFSSGKVNNLTSNNTYQYTWTSNPFIAHAFGGIDGKAYTNSLEAFETNYSKGHRVFEADLIFTSDGHLVAKHDWNDNPDKQPLSLQQFKAKKIRKIFTPLDFNEIANLMSKYKDIYLVTDTKETDLNTVKQQFEVIINTAKKIDPSIAERIIPQIYNEEMLPVIMNIYDFKSVIYTLYQTNSPKEEVIKFASDNGIKVITMSKDYPDLTDFVSKLAQEKIYTYVHTVNDINVINNLKSQGVHGFYTDFASPDDL